MKLGIISGSHRENAQTRRIARYFQERVQDLGLETYLFDLANNPLPLWDHSLWSGGAEWQEKWQPVAHKLKSCDGFVVLTPEWSGMVPSGLKNFFLVANAEILGHKPGLIVSVSSSRNGVYPVSELRMSSYKNNRICYIPEHIIVRNCESMLVDEQPRSDEDGYLRRRIDYSLTLLKSYAEAFAKVRNSGIVDHKAFPNGM